MGRKHFTADTTQNRSLPKQAGVPRQCFSSQRRRSQHRLINVSHAPQGGGEGAVYLHFSWKFILMKEYKKKHGTVAGKRTGTEVGPVEQVKVYLNRRKQT